MIECTCRQCYDSYEPRRGDICKSSHAFRNLSRSALGSLADNIACDAKCNDIASWDEAPQECLCTFSSQLLASCAVPLGLFWPPMPALMLSGTKDGPSPCSDWLLCSSRHAHNFARELALLPPKCRQAQSGHPSSLQQRYGRPECLDMSHASGGEGAMPGRRGQDTCFPKMRYLDYSAFTAPRATESDNDPSRGVRTPY